MLAHVYMITCKFCHQHKLQSAAIIPFKLPLTLILAGSVSLFCLVTMCWNFWKSLLLILLLGGDLGQSPASLEAKLPRVSTQYDLTNVLFATESFILDC